MRSTGFLRVVALATLAIPILVGLGGCKTHGKSTAADHFAFLPPEQLADMGIDGNRQMPMGASSTVVYAPGSESSPYGLQVAAIEQSTMRESATNLEQAQTALTAVRVGTEIAHAGTGVADWRRVLFDGNRHRYDYRVNNQFSGGVGGAGFSPEALDLLGAIQSDTSKIAVDMNSHAFQFASFKDWFQANYPPNP